MLTEPEGRCERPDEEASESNPGRGGATRHVAASGTTGELPSPEIAAAVPPEAEPAHPDWIEDHCL